MHADGRHPLLAWVAAATLLGAAGPAGAQVFGSLQLQYQNNDEVRLVLLPDSTFALRRTTSDLFLKTLNVRHQNYLRQNLLMDTDLRFSEITRPGSEDRVRAPSGTVRLLHPTFQVSALYRPVTARSTSSSGIPGLGADTSATSTTARTSETMLNGNARAPGGVQFVASWQHRGREGTETKPSEGFVARTLRTTLDRDRFSLYASAWDQVNKLGDSGQVRGRQRQFGTGGLWRIAPARTASLTLQYDLSAARSQPNATYTTGSTIQNAGLSGEWRPAPTFNSSARYTWRRTDTQSTRNTTWIDNEGALLGTWTPARGASATLSAGFLTQRAVDGSPQLLEYATAVVAGEGRVRPGWDLNASATHTTNWDPQRGTYGTQTLGGFSRMALGAGTTLDASLSMTVNGDVTAASQKWSNGWAARLNTQPLRSLALNARVRAQRVGPDLLTPLSMSRGATFEALWRPHPRADAIGNYSVDEAVTEPKQRIRTWSTTARAQITDRWQLSGLWTRTARPVTFLGVRQTLTQDTATGRLLWQPTRRVAASLSISTLDPGKEIESRRMDATFTWSFGR